MRTNNSGDGGAHRTERVRSGEEKTKRKKIIGKKGKKEESGEERADREGGARGRRERATSPKQKNKAAVTSHNRLGALKTLEE
ncbi:hypothetical protein RHMOL_Rhmol10G0262000 [Rhododendron molle]|uniref:Uncharacterized protein n=1 Tax=Rhododendron molle TaxID=49168 RepID=A0ACC0M7K9_RHOML|nr:hypothetical protein RHMOL_Rhmol10G0262000 [Rhododendron molle]